MKIIIKKYIVINDIYNIVFNYIGIKCDYSIKTYDESGAWLLPIEHRDNYRAKQACISGNLNLIVNLKLNNNLIKHYGILSAQYGHYKIIKNLAYRLGSIPHIWLIKACEYGQESIINKSLIYAVKLKTWIIRGLECAMRNKHFMFVQYLLCMYNNEFLNIITKTPNYVKNKLITCNEYNKIISTNIIKENYDSKLVYYYCRRLLVNSQGFNNTIRKWISQYII